MTDKQIQIAYDEAKNYKEKEAYISDMLLSSMFGFDEDVDMSNYELLSDIWECQNTTIKDVIDRSGLGQSGFARRFLISLRTVQHWYAGDRECPEYVKMMACEILGMIRR